MSIHKYKNSRHCTLWYVKYRNHTKRGFETKTSAEMYQAKLKLDSKNAEQCNYKFSQIASDYLEWSKRNRRYGTYMKSRRLIEDIILPNFMQAEAKISKINRLNCSAFREIVNDMKYSTIYKNNILEKFRAIFTYARKYYELHENPSEFLDPFAETYAELENKQMRLLNVWSVEEFEKFISCVQNEKYRLLFITLYFTGMRLGEALALTWNDYSNSVIHISKSLSRKTNKGSYEIHQPKTFSSNRMISLNRSLNEYLKKIMEQEQKTPGFKLNWFIFGRTVPLSQTTIDRIKEKAIKQAGVRRIRIHDFRHSHASNLISEGVNIVAVSKRLGHSSVDITLRVYTHLLQKNNDEMIEIIEKSSQNLLDKNKKP